MGYARAWRLLIVKTRHKIFNIVGLHVSNEKQWDDFLTDYGTGHFDKSFLICDATEGINQMELYFLRHLIHNQR